MRSTVGIAFGVAAAIALGTAPASAQRRELAILAGGNHSGANGGNVFKSEARQGFQAGLSLRMPRSARLSLQTELLVSRRRFYAERAPGGLPSILLGPKTEATSLLYVQLPVMLRFQRGYSTVHSVRPFLAFGGYAAVQVSCHREVVEADDSQFSGQCGATPTGAGGGTTPFVAAIYQEVDLGVLGAIGVEVRRFSISLRGERSIRSLVEPGALTSSPFSESKMWSVSASLEYLVRVL